MDKINWSDIQTLVTSLQQTDLSEFILETGDFRLVVRRGSQPTLAPAPLAPLPPPSSSPEQPKAPVEPAPARPPVIPNHWVNVVAPMVGTFYSAPAPGEGDFVRLGERVQKGQSVCIIEAMKLMNEVEAEVSGRVVEILVNNAQPVEYGQVLLRIDPND